MPGCTGARASSWTPSAPILAIAVVTLPIIAIAFVFGRIVYGIVRAIWRRTEGRPVRRTGAGAAVLAAAALLALAWWPDPERYQPIRPYEDGTIFAVANLPLPTTGSDPTARPRTTTDHGGEVTTVLPSSDSLPTEDEPQLALVLVPEGSDGTEEPAWIFPFNEPLPPEIGDNQALAVNTTDGTVKYNVAVAMVWVTGDEPVLNTNEAYAFASCADCVTVAVAFQVVLIVGEANVIVPQNLSGALNYECFECITASIASQLVVTIDSLPDEERQIALADLWEEIMAFAETIPTRPLADVIAQLDEYKAQILEILGVAPQVTPSASSSSSPSASPEPSGSSSATPSPSPSADAVGGHREPDTTAERVTPGVTGCTGAPTPSPSASATGEPRPEHVRRPTPSASPTPSPDPASAGS